MKKLLIYLKGYEKETVLAPLFKMLEALFELFVPLVMAAVIDTGIGGSNRGYIVRMCLILVAGCDRSDLLLTAQYFAAKAANRDFPQPLEKSCSDISRASLIRRWTRSVPLH